MKTKYTVSLFFFCLFFIHVNAQHVPNHILVKLKNEMNWDLANLASLPNTQSQVQTEWDNIQKTFSITSVSHPFKTRSEALDRTYLVVLQNDNELAACMREMAKLSFVEYAEYEPMYAIDYTPNDYTLSSQYYINKLKGEQAWNLTKGDTNVIIAIVDVGVMTDHVDLATNIFHNWAEVHGQPGVDDDANGYADDVMGWDAGDNDNSAYPPQVNFFDHGTHVAGCASAVADNGIGVAGIGFNCRILPVKAKSDTSTGSTLDATLGGVDYAISCGFTDIINMSFGGAGGYSVTWQNMMDAAYNKGIVVIAAAGNDNSLSDNYYPTSYNHVISVASSDNQDKKSWFSNYGTKIDVTAPGSAIKSTTVNGVNPPISGYQMWDGTSMASPVVAGVVGLMLSANPALSPDAVETCLKQTCDNINSLNPNFVGKLGAGRVNAFEAVTCVIPTAAPIADFKYDYRDACGGVIAFADLSQNIVTSFFWDFGNGQTSTLASPIVTYGTSGNYTVTYIAGNSLGYDTASLVVSVNALPVPVVDAGTNITSCYGQTVALNGTSSLSGTYVWNPSVGMTDSDSLQTQLYLTQSQVYTLTVYASNGCVGQDTVVVVSHVSPTLYAGADQTINPGASAQLNGLGANNLTFSWSPASSLSNPNIKNPIATPSITTLYTLTATNPDGCSKSDEVIVYVTGTTAIDPIEGVHILPIYPNPSEEGVTLAADFTEKTELSLVVFDVMGRKISDLFQGEVTDNKFSYFWEMNIAKGIYWVHWTVNNRTYVQKIIKN